MKDTIAAPKNKYRWLIQLGEWGVLFGAVLLAIWTVTQYREAPQLILLLLLYIITFNFSLPPAHSHVGLVPLVAVSSLLIVGFHTAVFLAAGSFLLAELTYPLWNALWEQLHLKRPSRRQRLSIALVHLIPLTIAGLIYQQLGSSTPLTPENAGNLSHFVWLAGSYGLSHLLLTMALWLLARRPFSQFLQNNALSVLMADLLTQPLAILGAITFVQIGLPLFIIFCLGVMAFSLVVWLSWQRRFILEQQFAQFAALNNAGTSLRETLDLPTVLKRTYQQVLDLIPTDSFFIALLDEDHTWQRPFYAQGTTIHPPLHHYQLDDFTQWVATRQKLLDLDRRNMHFATQHQLTPPTPLPNAWLGVPLTTANRLIGVMVLQRMASQQAFSRWSREVLLAIAAQASAAIHNAQQHSETVRLYAQTDKALAQRLKQLQALLNSIQEGVLMIDTNGRIALINPIAAALLGRAAASLQQQPVETAMAAAIGYEEECLTALLHTLTSGQRPLDQRATFDHTTAAAAGPAHRIIDRFESPVLAANQQVIGWLMLFRDVTEEHQLMEQKADLTRMIVHDLRNPITTLISTLNLIETTLQAAHSPDGLLTDAQQSCLDMLEMVDSLMDITRLEAGQFSIEAEAMRLPPLIEAVITRLHPLSRHRQIDLTFDCPPDLPPIWADEEMIRRVLVNLLDNALKFTPANGRITIHLQPETALSSAHEPGIRCTISDTGPGIPPEFQDKVFDRFMRTNQGGAQVRGTGLGLAFCQLAVEAHHGRIWAESLPTGGSCFIFTLPGIPIFP